MLRELRRLQRIFGRGQTQYRQNFNQRQRVTHTRNFKELFKILESFGIFYDAKKKIAIISKDTGDFIVDLLDGSVQFIPITCLKCTELQSCNHTRRKLCVIRDSTGWASFEFSQMDLLILSKIIAIRDDMLPDHVLNQIETKSQCLKQHLIPKLSDEYILHEPEPLFCGSRSLTLTFPQAPPIQGSNPPPCPPNLEIQLEYPSTQVSPSYDSLNIVQLRNLMLRELRNLKNLMSFSKNSR